MSSRAPSLLDAEAESARLLREARASAEVAPHPAVEARILRGIEMRRGRREQARRAQLGFGAGLVSALVAGALVLMLRPAAPTQPALAALEPNERVTLAQGPAQIELDAGAVLGRAWAEQVELLEGTAHFQVQKLALGHSFTVLAGDVSVRVIGTRFSVTRDDREVIVRVSEGVVLVEHGALVAKVRAGESWTSAPAPELAPAPAPPGPELAPQVRPAPARVRRAPEPAPAPAPEAGRRPTLAQAAAQVRSGDLLGAAASYRAMIEGGGADAPIAAYMLADLTRSRLQRPEAALAELDALDRRFSSHPLEREVRLLRIQLLLELDRCALAQRQIDALYALDSGERERLSGWPAGLQARCDRLIERSARDRH